MSREPNALSIQGARKVEKAWESFITGDDDRLQIVRPEIRASWLRSRQARVDPTLQRIPAVLAEEELQQRCHQQTTLLDVGRDLIPSFFQAFDTDAFIVGISDSNGRLLYSYGPPPKYDERSEINALPGGGVAENEIGTSAIGTALLLNRPVQVYGYEHYTAFGKRWNEYAAPLHDVYGNIVGGLTFAEHKAVGRPRMLDLVVFAANTIEERLRTCDKITQAEVLAVFQHQLLKSPDSSILALDMQGRILALSPALAKRAAITAPNHLIGRLLCNVRNFRVDGLQLPLLDESCQSGESFLIVPHRDKVTSMVIPIPSRRGQQVGLIIQASEPTRQPQETRKATPSLWQSAYTFQHLIGGCPTFQRALQLAKRAADHERPVLLVGESGTGKELFAQAIHSASSRASGPFVAINCSTIPKDLTASELFGYEEGAFSGAVRGGKRGKIALAHGGTLFLDELIDMPLDTQAHLLRCLEESQVVPLGSERPRAVDVRVIASMSIDALEAIGLGRLRLDLYHRLNIFPLVLPPLRERLDDLEMLALYLLEREGFAETRISVEVMELFRHHTWPGNIRELRNVLVRSAMLVTDNVIRQEHLPPEYAQRRPASAASPVRRLEKEHIVQALQECGGNKTHAAKRLGVHWMTLHRKMRKYGLTSP